MTYAEYQNLDQFTQLRIFRKFCAEYQLDHTKNMSRMLFSMSLDGDLSVAGPTGAKNVTVKA